MVPNVRNAWSNRIDWSQASCETSVSVIVIVPSTCSDVADGSPSKPVPCENRVGQFEPRGEMYGPSKRHSAVHLQISKTGTVRRPFVQSPDCVIARVNSDISRVKPALMRGS